jgi:hypothetical protein
MSDILIDGLVGAIGSSFIVKRVKEIKMYYADASSHDVLVAVCESSSCVVDHIDVNGATHRDVSLSGGDLVIGGKVAIKSGRMFIMSAMSAGML